MGGDLLTHVSISFPYGGSGVYAVVRGRELRGAVRSLTPVLDSHYCRLWLVCIFDVAQQLLERRVERIVLLAAGRVRVPNRGRT